MVLGFCSYRIHGSVRLRTEAPEEKPYGVFDKMAVHRSRRDEENMLIMAVAVYTFESKARGTSKGRGKNTDFGCMCVGIRRKYRREVQNTQRNLFGNPA